MSAALLTMKGQTGWGYCSLPTTVLPPWRPLPFPYWYACWAAAWVKDLLPQANHNFTQALAQVKTLVRVVSRTRARWVRNALGNSLIFDEASPFSGTIICLSGLVAIQVPLKLFNFAPS